MKRIKVTIEKETQKAFLITDGQNKGWIQRRWLGADSTVSEKTFEKSVNNYAEQKKNFEESKEWSNSYHKIITTARETEKAIAVKANFDAPNLERDFTRLVWVPKSLIKDMAIPGWFIVKKVREIAEQLYEEIHTQAFCDRISIEDCDRLFFS